MIFILETRKRSAFLHSDYTILMVHIQLNCTQFCNYISHTLDGAG